MRNFLQHSLLGLALMAAATPGALAADGAAKYSLGGGLERTPMVSTYDTSYLFDYNADDAKWTRTVAVGVTGNNYFSIFDSTGRKWSYEVLAVNGDHESASLVTPAYGNMEMLPSGVYQNITLTITETDGTPWLAISGFSDSEPIGNVWSVEGSFASASDEWMTPSGESIFTYEIPQVAEGDTLTLYGPSESDPSSRVAYGCGGDPIAAGVSYLLSEGSAPLRFDADYENVVLTWNAFTKRLSFTGVSKATGVGTLRPSSTTPTQGQRLVLTSPLTCVSFIFNQMENGIDKISRDENSTLKLLRDGLIYREIPTSDISAICINRNNTNQLDVNFEGITEGGNYSISLPQDFIELSGAVGSMLGSSDSTEETDPAKLRNAPFTLTFSITETVPFEISSKPGEVELDELRTIRISYPMDAIVKQNPAFTATASATLYYIDETVIPGDEAGVERSTKVSDYSVSFEGNEAVLTAKTPTYINDRADNASVHYYSLQISAGAWLVDYQGKTETLSALTYQPYTVKKSLAEDEDKLELTPAEGTRLPSVDFQTLKVKYPESYEFNAWSASNPMGKRIGYIVGYLRKVANQSDSEGENVGSYKIEEIDTSLRTLTLTLDTNAATLADGYYTVMLTNNLFILPDKSKNTNLYFTGYVVDNKLTTIEEVSASAETFDVYNLQGVCLMRGATDLTTLSPGLYIINGRKVLIGS